MWARAFSLYLIYLQQNAEMELGIQKMIGDIKIPIDFTKATETSKVSRLILAKNMAYKVPFLGRCDDKYGDYAS